MKQYSGLRPGVTIGLHLAGIAALFSMATGWTNDALAAKKPAAQPAPSRKAASSQSQSRKKAPHKAKAASNQTPSAFIEARVQKTLTDLKSRPLRPAGMPANTTTIQAQATKSPWMDALYDNNMVEASWATEMLADKRILAGVLERELGRRALIYYPKTLGLREFLVKNHLVNGNGEISVDGDRIEAALHDEFPSGYIVRPAVGVAPHETGKGLFPETDQFIVELLKPENPYYQKSHYKSAVKSSILNTIASGEAIVLQENVVGSADTHKPLKARFFQEVRIHTYEGRVVEGAVPSRWVQTNLLAEADMGKAEGFVADFLKSLPVSVLTRQAWGVDVAVMDNGEMRVIDVVTNRGQKIQWSSYLEQPRVIGAYTRHFESFYGLRFEGFSGTLIRNNFANYFPYWERRIEKARPGMGKVMAFIPPIP